LSSALPGGTLWLEAGDFLDYFELSVRPTGIQRVQMEIFAEAARLERRAGPIRFCRLDAAGSRFIPIELAELARSFDHPPAATRRRHARPLAFLLRERQKFRNTRRHFAWRLMSGLGWTRPAASAGPFAPGDVLFCLGTAWETAWYGDLIAAAKRRFGLRFAVLIHDIIPVTHPDWMLPRSGALYRHWLGRMIDAADLVFAVSQHTGDGVRAYAAARGGATPPVVRLPLGTGFRQSEPTGPALPSAALDRLPPRYVLFVATIEIRKNHRLLMRLWQRLIERHGAAAVPVLVLVGKPGWLVEDLMAELAASRFLDGKILLLSDLSDRDMAEAYRRCLFTVYPSLVEGWGLPVAESLAQGKLCIASNRASLPEVGGAFADYIDPGDEEAALAMIERTLFDEDYRRRREAEIREGFRPVPWADCAAALVAALDRPVEDIDR
jgi:glycosyltransferase involved in cell wall biosynthesis